MCELRHKNCITCYGYVSTEAYFGFVLEYADRGELRDILNNDSGKYTVIPDTISIKMGWGAAKGLAYLHERGILHKDIKSLNIFITKAFESRIGDFGLSHIQQGATTKGGTVAPGKQANTPAWACPELGDEEYNTKCDVYSFGVVLWEIATRKFPFDGDNDKVILKKVSIQAKRPDEAMAVPPEFTAEYNALVQRCWAQEPSDRPEMAEVATILKQIRDVLFEQLFIEIDLDGDNMISLSELIAKLTRPEYGFAEEQIRPIFEKHDEEGSGGLEKHQLIQLMQHLYD